MKAPCYQHDSYHSECSSCREMNGVTEKKREKSARRAMQVRMHQHLCMKWLRENRPDIAEQMWTQAKSVIAQYQAELKSHIAELPPSGELRLGEIPELKK